MQSLIRESLLRLNKEQLFDQCFKFISQSVLAFMELKFRYLPRFQPKKTSWVVICRGHSRYVEELHHLEPGPNHTSKELLRESRWKGNRLFCCRDEPIPHRGNSCAAGTCSCESRALCERYDSHGTKKWSDILTNKWHQDDALSIEISQFVMIFGTSL